MSTSGIYIENLDYATKATVGQIILIEKKNDNSSKISEMEVEELLWEHKPFKLRWCLNNNTEKPPTIAQLIFPTRELAEKAFAMFKDDDIIQLQYDYSQKFLLRYNKNFATCYIQGIPGDYDLQTVYSKFRNFGPVYKCQRLTPPSKIVMVHYYSIKHRDQALQVMNGYILTGDIQISVVCSTSPETSHIKARSKKKRPVNLQLQQNNIDISPSSSSPSSSITAPLTSPTILYMNTLPASYYYVRPQVQPPPVQQQRQRRPSLPKKIKLKQPSFEIKTSMDLCNLYIKGIQPGLTSSELFNLFKSFGRIISARVMEDRNSSSSNEAVTKRGFGFVSFSTSLEAAKALIEMYVEPEKGNPKYENDAAPPVMIVRFHEPRVPRPEHNFSYQLALLSYSPLGSHFYTRQKNNMVPLQPMAEEEEFSFVPPPPPPPPPPTTSSYATVTSPTSPSYFPTTTLINNANFNSPIPTAPSPSYYYYPSYWTDNQGVLYSNYISTSPPLPATLLPVSPGYMTTQLHQNNGYSYSTSNKNQYHHLRHSSWYGYMPAAPENGKNTGTPSISNKLIKLLESECHITSAENPKLVKCLIKLSKTEQSNCLNNSVYFEKKVSDLMASCSNGKNNSSTNNSEEQEQEED